MLTPWYSLTQTGLFTLKFSESTQGTILDSPIPKLTFWDAISLCVAPQIVPNSWYGPFINSNDPILVPCETDGLEFGLGKIVTYEIPVVGFEMSVD